MPPKYSRVSRRGFLRGTAGAAAAAGVAGLSSGLPSTSVLAEGLPSVSDTLSHLAPRGAIDESYWWKVRRQFNLKDGLTFMNTGTSGPTPQVVIDVQARVARDVAEDPTDCYRFEDREVVRDRVAEFVGVSSDDVTLTRNTTEGMAVFALGLDWREGDEVLMAHDEHPWPVFNYQQLERRYGIKIRWIELPAPTESADAVFDLYEKAITPKTRAIVVSHMMYTTGLLTPVKALSELARRRGLLISVDGAHPIGMLDTNVRDIGCHHYAAAGQKWLLCGTGTGLCFVHEEVRDQIWSALYVPPDLPEPYIRYAKGARKYDWGGQRNAPAGLGMAAAIELQQTIGVKNIEQRVREMSQYFREELSKIDGVQVLTPADPDLAAGLTTFTIREIPVENIVDGAMKRDRIYLRTLEHEDLRAVRASLHFFNMPEEVDRLLSGIAHMAKNYSDYME